MFQIIYTHTDFIIIDKYPGVSVHKDNNETALLHEISHALDGKPLFLVHRLDKMTSGLLLLARSSVAARQLSEAFALRLVDKYYLAIGAKKPKKKQGLVSGDMVKSRRSAWKLLPDKQHPAMTQFFSLAGDHGERVFLCRPKTGKTHQIRVALKSIGSAIVGDSIYNPGSRADRGYLHAYVLRFPYQNDLFSFRCDPRESEYVGEKWHESRVSDAIEQWQSPWALSWPDL